MRLSLKHWYIVTSAIFSCLKQIIKLGQIQECRNRFHFMTGKAAKSHCKEYEHRREWGIVGSWGHFAINIAHLGT